MADVKALMANLTPQQRAAFEQKLLNRTAGQTEQGIPRRKPTDPAPLSLSQSRLWFLDQLTQGSAVYNVPIAIEVEGDLDVEVLKACLDQVIQRHQVLRTTYIDEDGTPVLRTAETWSALRVTDLRALVDGALSSKIESLLTDEAMRPFDLSRDLVFRALLIRATEKRWVLSIVTHHIAWDAVSKVIFYRELSTLFDQLSAGKPASLPEVPIQYSDYALWQQERLKGKVLEREMEYWRQKLAGAATVLKLRTSRPRPPVQTFRGAKYPMALPPSALERARAFSKHQGNTLYMTLLAGFYVFLFAHTAQEDILVSSPNAGRHRVETESVIGFFINTMVLRSSMAGNPTFREVLARVRETTVGAYAHPDLSFDMLVDIVRPPRDLSRMPLTQVNFRVQNDPTPVPSLAGLKVKATPLVDNFTSKFDLALEVAATKEGCGYFEYNTDLIDESMIVAMCEDYRSILERMFDQPDSRIADLANELGITERYKPRISLRSRDRKAVPLG